MSNNTEEELDTGNRGALEVSGKSKKLNKIIALIAMVATVLVILVAVNAMFGGDDEAPVTASVEKSNTLERNESEDRTVAGRMNEITQMMLRDKKAALDAEQAKQDAAAKEPKENPPQTASDAIDNIRQASGRDSDSDEQPATADNNEQKPMLKKDRILAGETLIDTESNHQDGGNAKEEQDDLKGITRSNGNARRITNRHFLIPAGTALSCTLKTRIVTSYPGVTLCQLNTDIYSADGKVLLVRKGAQLLGDQQRALLQGAARIFINWTTISDGDVDIRIDALGTDSLGASGVPGWVDSHFWKRFGGAIMLSFIDDALGTMKNLASKANNSNFSYDSTADSTQQMSEIALQNSINIPDTGYVNQGTVISVIVPRNVDFSGVYKLR